MARYGNTKHPPSSFGPRPSLSLRNHNQVILSFSSHFWNTRCIHPTIAPPCRFPYLQYCSNSFQIIVISPIASTSLMYLAAWIIWLKLFSILDNFVLTFLNVSYVAPILIQEMNQRFHFLSVLSQLRPKKDPTITNVLNFALFSSLTSLI